MTKTTVRECEKSRSNLKSHKQGFLKCFQGLTRLEKFSSAFQVNKPFSSSFQACFHFSSLQTFLQSFSSPFPTLDKLVYAVKLFTSDLAILYQYLHSAHIRTNLISLQSSNLISLQNYHIQSKSSIISVIHILYIY